MTRLADIQAKYLQMGIGTLPEEAKIAAAKQFGLAYGVTTEKGSRATPENAVNNLYRRMYVDTTLRSSILDIRYMDRMDPRVKKIHGRMARAAVKGGLRLFQDVPNARLSRLWKDFERRLGLNRQEKLESDARGLVMEGNLPLQIVLDGANQVVRLLRMPSETIVPQVTAGGVIRDPADAYHQVDMSSGGVIARFPLWQLVMVRLTPDNFDDLGSLGRPYLDATRTPWKKLTMTEEDLVIRRKTRAAQRRMHRLESAGDDFFQEYVEKVEADKFDQTTDFFIKGKGEVTNLSGDASLDQVADVVHLLDTFFAGAPAPKGLFGYSDSLSRDILQDLKIDFFEELDATQDTLAYGYTLAFRLDLLLHGVNPDNYAFSVGFAERKTDTPNQRADLALKFQALGASKQTTLETAGIDAATEAERLQNQANGNDPYPPDVPPQSTGNQPRVSITPSNAPKGQSATTISTRSGG